VTATYDYDAFGNLLSVNDHLNPFRYCGEYWDYETKRYYFRARYYSPATGRFTQRDKFLGFYADPLSLNRYTYAHNNPIKYIDPSGYVVTQWDLDNCSPEQIAQIKAATDAWNAARAANDRAAMDAAHAAANAARAGNLSPGQSIGGQGYVYESDGSFAPGGNTNVYLGNDDAKRLTVTTGGSKSTVVIAEQIVFQSNVPNRPASSRVNQLEINYGSTGEELKYMQYALWQLGYFYGLDYIADGEFGMNTLAAFLRFQLQNGWKWNNLFNNDGTYIGVDKATMRLLCNYSIDSLRKSGYNANKYSRMYNPAHETTLVNGIVHVNLISISQLERIYRDTNHHKQGTVTLDTIRELNSVLYKYDITTTERIQFFLGVAMHESRTSLTQVGRSERYRGAGYIQITGYSNYSGFATSIDKRGILDMSDPARYVADNYAWEASGWWWQHNKMNDKITASIAQGLSNTEIFKRVSNAVFYGDYYRSGNPDVWESHRLPQYHKVCNTLW